MTIRLARGDQQEPLPVRSFVGRLTLRSRRLTICNTSNDVLLQTGAPDGFAQVTVSANGARHADEILVTVE